MTTTHEYRDYVFRITYSPHDPSYVVEFPDIPEIITSGYSLDEAFSHACEALDLHLESLLKLSLPLPTPRHRLVLETISPPA
jgi:predicted RNase H-like HicB family nuclease